MINTTSIGRIFEQLSIQHLIENNYTILATNYRYINPKNLQGISAKRGELDIIAIKNNNIHFFEVRKRKKITYDYPVVSTKKIQNLFECALNFLENNAQYTNNSYQIDLITIDGKNNITIFDNITANNDF